MYSDDREWIRPFENNEFWWYVRVQTGQVLAIVHKVSGGWKFEIDKGSNFPTYISPMYISDSNAKIAAINHLKATR